MIDPSIVSAGRANASPESNELLDEARARGLTIGEPRAWALDRAIDVAVRDELRTEGYFAAPPSVPAELLARCLDAIELVRAAGAPPLAAFAFDALWELATVVFPHADLAFAAGARLMPAFWAWRIEESDARGWEPHRDRPGRAIDDDGQPESIALWVPLTDATVDNGCMYLVPAPWDPLYPNPRATADVVFQQAVRAVPARAGAVLGWTSRLLHWGSMARPGRPLRISVGFEFQDAARAPFDNEVFERGWTPPPARRAALIEQQWDLYGHLHRGDDERRAALVAVVAALLGGP